jgi:hypothetical protein
MVRDVELFHLHSYSTQVIIISREIKLFDRVFLYSAELAAAAAESSLVIADDVVSQTQPSR